MHDPQSPGQAMGRRRIERGVQAGDVVRVEVIAHQRDEFRVGIVDLQQVPDFLGPVATGALISAGNPPPAPQRIEEGEQRLHALPLIMMIFATRLTGLHRQRWFDITDDLLGGFIHTD